MKEWTLRFRVRDKNNFNEVKSGLKSIETRAASPRYQSIKEGDIVVFVCGDERFTREVAGVRRFKSISAMLKEIDYKKIMPSVGSEEEMIKIYHAYPNYKEKIKEFGLVALELK